MRHRLAYLVSEFPAASHTFILREIQSLRKEGFSVLPISVNGCKNLEKLGREEQQEAQITFTLKEADFFQLLHALLYVAFKSPRGCFSMLKTALGWTLFGPVKPVKALGYLLEAVLIIPWLRANQTTHIHEHFANPTALVALLLKKYGGFSYSLSVHGPDIFYEVDGGLLTEKVCQADFVRCISHYCRGQLMRITPASFWPNLKVVRCGIDPAAYRPEDRESGKQTTRILCVGRMVPAKGQHLLIQACSALAAKGEDFHLTLVGDGPDRETLEKAAKGYGLQNHVTFTGVLNQKQVQHQYNLADVFVLPSFAEGVPVVLMEAMSKEIAVISTRITGIPELIDHEKDGILVTSGDVPELQDQLQRLITDRALRVRLGRTARWKVETHYNQNRNNSLLAQLFPRENGHA